MRDNQRMMAAFIFDSGKLESNFYREVVFEHMLSGMEVSENPFRIVVSMGDIFEDYRYVDIEPYVINNDFCTIDFESLDKESPFQDYPFCWVMEDICKNTAFELDKRLKKELRGYVGVTEIDSSNQNGYKQFWKS